MVDQHFFFFEALTWVDNNTFLSNNISKCLVIFYCPQHVCVFFLLNNSSSNKWLDFKIPFWNICTIIPFPTCFLIGYLDPLCSNFIMFWHWNRRLIYNSTNLPNLSIIFAIFFSQCSKCDLDYHILQFFNVCAHIPMML